MAYFEDFGEKRQPTVRTYQHESQASIIVVQFTSIQKRLARFETRTYILDFFRCIHWDWYFSRWPEAPYEEKPTMGITVGGEELIRENT